MLRLASSSPAPLRQLARRQLTHPDARIQTPFDPCHAFASLQLFHSRAHPVKTPEYNAKTALEQVLEGTKQRFKRRQRRWSRLTVPRRKAKGLEIDGPYRNQDETVEFAANLNLDPRRPGQAIRGSITLPHGTGKSTDVVVFTLDEDLAKRALEEGGAKHAGGSELIEQISNGEIGLDSFQRAYATSDIVPNLSKSLARMLGPRGLMPNPKMGTVFDNGGNNADAAAGEIMNSLALANSTIQFRADAFGIVHVPVGKASLGSDKLLDNLRAVCQTIHESKPEHFGKGKKKSTAKAKNAKYWLRAHVSATQGKGVRLNLKNIDPTSPFFLQDDEEQIDIAA